jgi:hypothetical protein
MAFAISEMPIEEQYLQDDDPDLLVVLSITSNIRGGEVLRAYKLRQKLKKTPREAHEKLIERWALATGRSAGAWKADLKWANAIDPDDLLAVFAASHVTQDEWVQRIGTSHLRTIARVKDLSSHSRAKWAWRAYDANLSVTELEQLLRDSDLLPPKRGSGTVPVAAGTPATACDLLERMAAHLRSQGIDLDLSAKLAQRQSDRPIDVAKFLSFLSSEFGKQRPGAAFVVEVGKS